MQKKLIAIAVAGLVSGAAFAADNVTVYGVVDGTYDNVKATGATTATGLNYQSRGRTTMNSSYIGFKGAESMGNGLTAVFQIESGVGENAGATNTMAASTYGWANRDTMAALAGGFGVVAFGNLTGPARALGATMDPNSGDTGIGSNAALIGKLGGGAGASYTDNRFANAIAYISPSMGGATIVFAYVPNENRSATVNGASSATDTSAYTLGVNFAGGPVTAGGAWTEIKDKGTAGFGPVNTNSTVGAAPIDKYDNYRLAGKFDFGMGTVGLMLDQTKATVHGVSGDVKQTVLYVPVTFKVGAGTIIGQFGQAGKLTNPLGADGNDFKAQHLMIGYEHALSKRTTVKALYSQITNKSLASYDYLYGVSNPNGTGTTNGVGAGADPRGFSVGMRHSF
jgi:predicted porin